MDECLAIQTDLVKQFPFLDGKIRTPRARRIFAAVPAERFGEVFAHAIDKMDFSMLCTITGLDSGQSMEVIYHLARPSGAVLNISIMVPKDRPVVKTVTDRFPAAELYEREMVDLLGMQVEGLAPGLRYPLPDGWPAGQYPLRKDWKQPQDKTEASAGQEEPHAQ